VSETLLDWIERALGAGVAKQVFYDDDDQPVCALIFIDGQRETAEVLAMVDDWEASAHAEMEAKPHAD
jgi:hypothetical protein